MNILIGLLIIAVGAFCQSSSYVPINRIKQWSWESYWIVQGIFAWLLFPLLGAFLAVPEGHSLFELFNANQSSYTPKDAKEDGHPNVERLVGYEQFKKRVSFRHSKKCSQQGEQ